MGDRRGDRGGVSRREFVVGAAAAATGLGSLGLPACASRGAADGRAAGAPAAARGRSDDRYNILFVFSDQERYLPALPAGLELPGHERLRRTGVTFHRHYGPAVMCTPSRSVLMTGLQTPNNGMFDNTNWAYQEDLSTEIPTIGDMLRKAGYHTAYKGKWHLNQGFDSEEPRRLIVDEMEAYGFSDYFSAGDVVGHTLGGYENDHMIAGNAVRWLRLRGRPLNDEGRPWALVVSLVNPHDAMYFNTDAPGERVQDDGTLLFRAARAPNHEAYRATWDLPLPETLGHSLDAPGRPRAHAEYQRMWDVVLGQVPLEEARWRRFGDYYLNCLRQMDAQLARLLGELDALGLSERTIVVYSSDHGEMGGAHGLRGKGPFVYEENLRLPLHVVHPDVPGGQECRALSSHIDLPPTLLALAGADAARREEFAGGALPGRDLTPLLQAPGRAAPDAVRPGALFVYSGLATNDAGFFEEIARGMGRGKTLEELLREGLRPDLSKRGSIRSVLDGRHKLSRYFAPIERNRPKTLEELYRWNDVELFDLETDPSETRNLAARPGENDELVLALNAKLEALIQAEIGADDGREMPDADQIDWTIGRFDL